MGRLYGQAHSHASSYNLEWRRDFPFQCGIVPVGAAADDGTLWLIAHAGPGKPQRFLVRIDPSGQSIKKYDPTLPLRRLEWVSYLSPAASGQSVGLLASVSSGGGHLAIGEGPSPHQQVFAEFDRSGRLIWQQTSSAPYPQLLVPFKTGFYVIRDLFEGEGMNIDKYVY
jgi:hypothetical protein